MGEWWDSLSLMGQIFCLIAIPATVVMLIQSLLMFFGMGFDSEAEIADDIDGDGSGADGDGLSLITVRGLVAFFAVGGWTGLAVLSSGAKEVVAVIISFFAGLAALFGIAILFKYSLKLQDAGNISTTNAIGKEGSVYIPIPPNQNGVGKITITIQERYIELSAMTKENRVITTGERITVVEKIDDQTVLVISHDEDNNTRKKRGKN